jgi:hypothetical protein
MWSKNLQHEKRIRRNLFLGLHDLDQQSIAAVFSTIESPAPSSPPNTKILPSADAKPKPCLGLGNAPLTRPDRFFHVILIMLNEKKSFNTPDSQAVMSFKNS